MSKLLDLVEREQEHVVVTRNGKPVAVVMSADEWESWEETIEVLSDVKTMAAPAETEEDVKAGRLFTVDEVWKHLGRA